MRFSFLRKKRKHGKVKVPSNIDKTCSTTSQTIQSSSCSYDSSELDSCSSSSEYSQISLETSDQGMPMQLWKKYGDYMQKILNIKSLTLEEVDNPQELLVEDYDFGEVNSIIEDGDDPPSFKQELNTNLNQVVNFLHKTLSKENHRAFNQDAVEFIDSFQINGCLFVDDYVGGCCHAMEFRDDDFQFEYDEDNSTYDSKKMNEDVSVSSKVPYCGHEGVIESKYISDYQISRPPVLRNNPTEEKDHIEALESFIFTQTINDPTVDFGFAMISSTDIEITPSLDSDCGLLSGEKVRNKKFLKKKQASKW